MKKFKCTVTKTDEYIIEIDENKINEEWMEDFRGYMYSSFYEYEDHAEHLAQLMFEQGEGFYEGYGRVKINGKEPSIISLNKSLQDEYEDGININITDQGETEVYLDEIEQEENKIKLYYINKHGLNECPLFEEFYYFNSKIRVQHWFTAKFPHKRGGLLAPDDFYKVLHTEDIYVCGIDKKRVLRLWKRENYQIGNCRKRYN